MAPLKLDDIRKVIEEENQKLLGQVEKKWEQINTELRTLEERNGKRNDNNYKNVINEVYSDSRIRNIVIEGISRGPDDESRDQEVFRVLNHIMGTNCKQHDIDFISDRYGRNHLIVIVGFTTIRKKLQVLKAKKHLRKVGKIKIYEDLSIEERKTRQKLVPVMKEARKEGKFAVFKRDKLFINGRQWKQDDKQIEDGIAGARQVHSTGLAVVCSEAKSTWKKASSSRPSAAAQNDNSSGDSSDSAADRIGLEDSKARHATVPGLLDYREVRGKEITLYTYNCRNLSTVDRAVELVETSRNLKWDIIGLSEIRRDREVLLSVGQVEMFLNDTDMSGGTGIAVNNRSSTNVKSYKSYSHRVLKMIWKFNTGAGRIKILQVNAPGENENDAAVEDFYSELQTALNRNYCKYVFVMGSWKCIIGRGAEAPYVGGFGLGTRNRRGERLLQFAEENNLYVMNTFYQKSRDKKWTWTSPDGRTRHQTDYFLSNHKNIVTDIETDNSLNLGSDYTALKIKIRFKPKQKNTDRMEKRTVAF